MSQYHFDAAGGARVHAPVIIKRKSCNIQPFQKKSMPRKARVTRKKTTAANDAFEVQLDRRSDAGPEVPADSESNAVAPTESESNAVAPTESESNAVAPTESESNAVAPAEPESNPVAAPAEPESNPVAAPAEAVAQTASEIMPTVANPDAEPELRDGQVHVIMGLLATLQGCINALQDRVRLLELNSESGPRERVVFTEEYRRLLDKIKSKPIATMNVETLKRLLTMCD